MKKIEVIILTCEKYLDVFEAFMFLAEKYWKDHPRFIVAFDNIPANVKTYKDVEYINGGINYSCRIKKGLHHINTDFVFFLMDDYFLCDTVSNNKIIELINLNKDYIRLFADPIVHTKKINNLQKLPLNHDCYEVNCSPSIWKKDVLLSLLDNETTPWELEISFDKKCREKNFDCYKHLKPYKIFPYKHGAIKGKYFYGIKNFLRRQQYKGFIRKENNFFDLVKYKIIIFLKRILPNIAIKFLKRITKKEYLSDKA